MAITFVGASTIVEVAGGTPITLDTATITGLADDDLMLFCVLEDDNIAIVSNDGLTESVQGGSGNRRMAVYRKVALTEGGTYSFQNTTPSNKEYTGVILAYRGVDTTTPEDATAQLVERANDTTPAAATITTVSDNAWVVTVLGSVNAGTTLHTGNQPAGYTIRADIANAGDRNLCAADLTKTPAGLETPGDWGDSAYTATTDHVSITVALKPAGDINIEANTVAIAIVTYQSVVTFGTPSGSAELMKETALGNSLIDGGLI